MCRVDGRKVVVTAGDFTVRGGSGSGSHGGLGEELSASQRALEWRLPYVRLLDAAGGSVRSFEEIGRTYLPDANSFTHTDVTLLNTVPVVSAVMGAAAGIGALHTQPGPLERDGRQHARCSPAVRRWSRRRSATTSPRRSSAARTSTPAISGVVDNFAATEEDAIRMIRQFLSYLPSSVDELAPRGETCRSGRPPRRRAARRSCRSEPRRVHNAQQADRARRRRGLVLPDRPALRPGPDHRAGPDQRLPGRRDGQRPDVPRRRHRRRRRAQGVAADAAVRPVPPPARRPRRRARPDGRPGVGEAGHRARRRPPGVHHQRLPDAVDHDRRPPPVRRRRPDAPPLHRDVPPLRVAERALGLDAHRRRRLGRVPPGDRGGRRPGAEAARDRGRGSTRSARRSAPPRPPARTSSIHATPGRCSSTSSRTPSASSPASSARRRCPTCRDAARSRAQRSASSCSRSTRFWILVADIGHSVTKRTSRGTLNEASWPRQKAMSSSAVADSARGQLDERHRHLAVALVVATDHLHELHRRVGAEVGLDLGRGDVLPADLHHLLDPGDVGEVAVVVHHAEVAGADPAAVEDRGRGRVRIVEVGAERVRPAELDLATLAARAARRRSSGSATRTSKPVERRTGGADPDVLAGVGPA